MDGEEGFSAVLSREGLVLKKGDMRVEMPRSRIRSAKYVRTYRYGRALLVIGAALLVAFGLGAALIALYYLSKEEALVLRYRRRDYVLTGERAALSRIRGHVLPRHAPAQRA